MMKDEIIIYFENKSFKTKDVSDYAKKLIKSKTNVSELKPYVLDKGYIHRIYFQVSLANINDNIKQMNFIEENMDLLQEWWHVDGLLQMLNKPLDFNDIFSRAQKYVKSNKTFERRLGYVIFITGLQKDTKNFDKIVSLFHDDDEHYVSMAMAWLLAELCVYSPEKAIKFIETSNLKYNILGKAIQKIQDSFCISKEIKDKCKNLREVVKNN